MGSDGARIDVVLEAYRQLMLGLHRERALRGAEPWYECPMTLTQLRALSLIGASERGLSSRELASRLAVGASAITPLVDRLVERGFVRRHEDPRDRRIARLEATDTGMALIERMSAGQADVVRDILAQLQPAELATVSAAFDVLLTGLHRATANGIANPSHIPTGTTA